MRDAWWLEEEHPRAWHFLGLLSGLGCASRVLEGAPGLQSSNAGGWCAVAVETTSHLV